MLYEDRLDVLNNTNMGDTMLSAGINLEQLIDALTDDEKRFNFPIALPPLEISKDAETTIFLAVGGLILGGLLITVIAKR